MNAKRRLKSSYLSVIKLVYLNLKGRESGPESRLAKKRSSDC